MTLWKAARVIKRASTDGGNRREAGNLSGDGTEGASVSAAHRLSAAADASFSAGGP